MKKVALLLSLLFATSLFATTFMLHTAQAARPLRPILKPAPAPTPTPAPAPIRPLPLSR